MPRLKNAAGVVVNVSDETADLLGSEWGDPDETGTRSENPDRTWKVAELRAHADDHGIDLGDATKKDDILAVLNQGE